MYNNFVIDFVLMAIPSKTDVVSHLSMTVDDFIKQCHHLYTTRLIKPTL